MKTGQMFIISVIFLAGLVFAVQQILLQYASIDQPGFSNLGDYYILKNINSTLRKVVADSVNCVSAGCILFAGKGGIIAEDRPSLNFGQRMGMEGWFRLSGGSSIALIKSGSYALGFENGTEPYFSVWIGGTEQKVSSGMPLEKGRFYHMAAMYNGSEARIYIDGFLKSRRALSGSIDSTGGNLTIGSSLSDSGLQPFYGFIDELALYNASLEDEQALYLHERKAINISPAAQWRFEESGKTVKDSAGQADGIMEGFAQGEGRVKGIDCEEAERKLREADDFIGGSSFGRYSVAVIYGETAEPKLECGNIGQPGKSILSAKVRIVSGVSETTADLRFG